MDSNQLKTSKVDILVSAAKSALGAVPLAGPLLSELIGNIIPNQRLDRLSEYVILLEEKLSKVESALINKAIQNEYCIDLIEEGFYQASRAITIERREYIANVVVNGLTDAELEYQESKYMLKILQDLNDQEVIWLRYYLRPTIGGDEEFRDKHKNVLTEIHIANDERSAVQQALQQSYQKRLESFGLLKSTIRLDSSFDDFPKEPEVTFDGLTPLGKRILKQVGLYDPEQDIFG